MKKIVYSLFSLLLFALAGCTHNEVLQPEPSVAEGDNVTVRFSALIPEFKTVQTRANGGVNDMYLLVFDENGNFISRAQAELSAQTDTGGTFKATLPSSNRPRRVHFISNYDWTGFSDANMAGSNEAAVVALLSTTNATFWARHELDGGINATCFNGVTIPLLRNQAKITVESTAAGFVLEGFTIHKTPAKGTVAPFNTGTGQFAERAITEPIGLTLTDAVLANVNGDAKYLFERKNKNASVITTVIVKGKFQGGASSFYKIDLINTNKIRYDIERNYHYVVKIQQVQKAGFDNFGDALDGASHNNTALDPIIEKYPMISDGVSKLEVEKTLVIVTEPNKPIQVWAKFYPDINSDVVDNSEVTAVLDDENEVLQPATFNFNNTTGIITATAVSAMPAEPKETRIIVSKGDLARAIRVVMRPAFSFTPVTINSNNPATLSGAQGQSAELKFTIPADFPNELLPLPVSIYTQGLYPATSGLQMVVEQGVVHYIYLAESKGVQTVQFKTNKSGNTETVTLNANYFVDGMVGYNINSKTGNLNYIPQGGVSTPVPYALRDKLSAAVGFITVPMNEDGKYIWNYPTGTNTDQKVSLTLQEGNRLNIYSANVNPANVTNIVLPFEKFALLGNITYGGANVSAPANTLVPSRSSITASVGSISVTSNGQFRYDLPATYNNNTSVTFTYEKQVNAHYKERYAMTTTIGNLLGGAAVNLTPTNFVFEGSIQYLSWGSWRDVPSGSTVSASVGSVVVPSNGRYRYTVPTSTSNSQSIQFSFTHWSGTYRQGKTLNQLKSDASLRLER